jgi:hypothetical protein
MSDVLDTVRKIDEGFIDEVSDAALREVRAWLACVLDGRREHRRATTSTTEGTSDE